MSKIVTFISDLIQTVVEAALVYLAALCLHGTCSAIGRDWTMCLIFVFALICVVFALDAMDNYIVRHYRGTHSEYYDDHISLRLSSKQFYLVMLVLFITLVFLAYNITWIHGAVSEVSLYTAVNKLLMSDSGTAYIIIRCMPTSAQRVFCALGANPEMTTEEANVLIATCNSNIMISHVLWFLCAIPLHASKLFVRYLGLKKREERFNAGVDVQNRLT